MSAAADTESDRIKMRSRDMVGNQNWYFFQHLKLWHFSFVTLTPHTKNLPQYPGSFYSVTLNNCFSTKVSVPCRLLQIPNQTESRCEAEIWPLNENWSFLQHLKLWHFSFVILTPPHPREGPFILRGLYNGIHPPSGFKKLISQRGADARQIVLG